MDFDALAKQFGGAAAQPAQPVEQVPAWASNLAPKDLAEIKMKRYLEGTKRLAEAQDEISRVAPVVEDLNEFGRLNRQSSTGSWWQQLTPDKSMFRSNDSMQMAAITARLAPWMRPPGSGASSDKDTALFLRGLPSVENEGPVNKGIRDEFQRKYESAVARAKAMQQYLNEKGHLDDFDVFWAQQKAQQPRPAAANSAMSGGGWSARKVK